MSRLPVITLAGELRKDALEVLEAEFDAGRPHRSTRHLLSMFLLLAIKDRAKYLRFEPVEGDYLVSYTVRGTWRPLVPPPRALAEVIADVCRRFASPSGWQYRTGRLLRRWAGRLDHLDARVVSGRFLVKFEEDVTEVRATIESTHHGPVLQLEFETVPDARISEAAHHVLKAYFDEEVQREFDHHSEACSPGPRSTLPTLSPPKYETIAGATYGTWTRSRSCLDVLEACLACIEDWEPRIHAWAFLDIEGARERARELDAGRSRGLLFGVPVGVKDIYDVRGMPTGCGSPTGADRIAEVDAPLVARLREAGAIIVGKTVTTPYAWIDPPPTRNPWDTDRTPGGSSSGSAAALACGMVLGALGSQTGGSITRPAAYCGVAGMKPTHGRLPLDGILPLSPTLDHPGPMARTVADLEPLWQVLSGPDVRDGLAYPDGTPIRLGRLRGPFDEHADPAMRAALDEWLARIACDEIKVIDVPLAFDFDAVISSHRTILAAEAGSFHERRLAERPDAYPPQIRALIEEGLTLPASSYVRARQHCEATRTERSNWFADIDAFVTPAALGMAPDPTTTGSPLFHSPWSFAGLPTVTFPIGLEDGLPLGLQLIGKPFMEWDLLRIARRCAEAIS
jgi:aspartyl-tRNA(Asn)/glutamyl-tRNA(Gln) amidotransferase subunit A